MPRWKHHVRKGDGFEDRRDLQVNGRPRASEDWRLDGGDFRTIPGSYTGFASDGRWYEQGVAVVDSLTEKLGSDVQPLNSRKWALSGAFTWQQEASALLVEAPDAVAGVETFAMQAPRHTQGWHLRGDFLIRLRVADCTIGAGTADDVDGADNAVWLGIRRLTSAGTALRVKRYRGETENGFAVEVEGGGQFVGAVANDVEDFVLVLQRHAGELVASVVDDEGVVTDLWGPFPWPGIAHVEIGARNAGSPGWSFRLLDFQHDVGRHTYSARASWWREGASGAMFEDFWGDELDPQLWTVDTDGTGSVEVVPGVDDEPGTGLRLTAPDQVDLADVAFPHVTGDHTVTVEWSFPDTVTGTPEAPEEDVVLRLLVESSAVRPALYLEVTLDGLGKLNARACRLPGGGGDAVVLDAWQDGFGVVGDQRYRFTVRRIGTLFHLQIVDPGQNVVVEATADDLPSLPVAYKLQTLAASSLGSVQADVQAFRLVTPNALVLEKWPQRFYAATTKAAEGEVVVTGGEPLITVSEVTIIDVATRTPVWRVVGGGNGDDDPGQQALPQGEIWDPFFDADGGRLWIPVRNPEEPTDGSWTCVDLRLDVVRQKCPRPGVKNRTFARAGAAPVAYRQLGLGYEGPDLDTDDFGQAGMPPRGLPVKYERFRMPGDEVWHVWATRTAGVMLLRRAADVSDMIEVLVPKALPSILSTVNRIAVVPGDATRPAQLVVSAAVRTDLCVVVYRDLGNLVDEVLNPPGGGFASATVYGAAHADAVYTRETLNGDWDGADPQPTAKLFPEGSGGGGDVDAFVAPSHVGSGGDGLCLIALPQLFAVTLLQERPDPADTVATYWQRQSEGIPAHAPLVITGQPKAVRLTRDADVDASPPRGFLAVQEQGEVGGEAGNEARVQVVSLARQNVRHSLLPADVDAVEFEGVDSHGESIRIIEAPPDLHGGARLVWSYEDVPGAVVEWDLWGVEGGPWRGPHIGGTTLEMTGWGLDNLGGVLVGGVACFKARVDPPARAADGRPVLRAVNRALAFVLHGLTPVMSDAELEAQAEWPADIEIVGRDGARLVLPDGFVYDSVICIEEGNRRMVRRLPEPVLDNDSKSDTWQRHLATALAWLICRMRSEWMLPLFRDTYRAEAQGEGLAIWSAAVGAPQPYAAMSEAQLRAFALAKAYGRRITVKAVKDILEPIFGVRPEVVEGYREFTVLVDLPDVLADDTNFWAEDDEPEPLAVWFWGRDFWAGDDPRLMAAQGVLDICRAAGVRARVGAAPPA